MNGSPVSRLTQAQLVVRIGQGNKPLSSHLTPPTPNSSAAQDQGGQYQLSRTPLNYIYIFFALLSYNMHHLVYRGRHLFFKGDFKKNIYVLIVIRQGWCQYDWDFLFQE